MGNRGILHDDARHVLRSWQVRRWLACRTEFRGRKRSVMRPHSYTELFFLDEATALGAGHRPCAECRHADYQRFRSLWEARYGPQVSADLIDVKLHADRLDERKKRTYEEDLAALPEGTYVAVDRIAWLVWQGALFAWSSTGYARWYPRPAHLQVDVLTPRSTVELLRDGYVPGVHPSVDAKRFA